MDDILVLIGIAYRQNELLEQETDGETRTEIFGEARSVTRSEWYEAWREGMRPAVLFVTSWVNYNGQQEAELRGIRYRIYRTYRVRDTDLVELYLEEKAGVTHG